MYTNKEYELKEKLEFFTDKEKVLIYFRIQGLFNNLNKEFIKYDDTIDSNFKYFNELLVIQRVDQKINILYHYIDGINDREDLSPKQLDTIIDEFIISSPYDMFLFIKDQKELDFDYITRAKTKNENILVLLNNIEYSLDEIQQMYPNAWKGMNLTHSNLHFKLAHCFAL